MDSGFEVDRERYRALFESLECVYVHDLGGQFLDANRASLDLLGFRLEEFLALDIFSLVHPDQHGAVLKLLAELRETGRLRRQAELRVRRRQGDYVDIEVKAAVITRNGRPHGILGIARDITRLRQAERALADHNEALLRLNRFSIDLSMLPQEEDLEAFVAGQLLDIAGGRAAILTQYDPAERMATVTHIEIEPKMFDGIVRLLGRQLVGFQTRVPADVYDRSTTDLVRMTKDLHEASFGAVPRPIGAAIQALLNVDRFWGVAYTLEGSLYGTSLVAMGKGKPDPPEGVLKNFSFLVALAIRRRRVEAALRESEQRHRLLADNASDVIWTMEAEGNVTYVSPSVEKLRGFTPLEVMKYSLDSPEGLLTPQSAVYARKALGNATKALQAGESVPELRGAVEQPCKDGSTVWTEHRVTAMRDADGHWIGFLGVSRDITERRKDREALEQSEERFKSLSSMTSEGIMLHERGMIVDANQAMADLLGYAEPDELIGKNGLEIIPLTPESRQRLEGHAATGSTETYEIEFVNSDGSTRWVETRGRTVTYREREARLVSMRDITERKRAEADQELSGLILQILNEPGDVRGCSERVVAAIKAGTGFEAVGIRMKEGDDFPYIAIDGFPADFLGTENTLLEKDAKGETCKDENGEIGLACTCGLVISGKTDPASPYFTKGGSFWTNDASALLDLPPADDPRVLRRNTCIKRGHASIALVPIRDKLGIVGVLHLADRKKGRLNLDAVVRLEGIAAHIGAALVRRQAETALQESQERYRTLVNVSPDAILVDVEGRFAFANPAAARLFGARSPEDLFGQEILDRVHPDYRELVAARAVRVAAGEVTPPREIKVLRLDGTAVDVEAVGARIEFDGRWARQIIYRDISERKQAEARQRDLERQLQERQKLESLGVLAGGIAHDFNNMLTAIIGYSDLILTSSLPSPEETWADVREIKEAAERAQALTGAILAFSRRQPRETQILELNSLVMELDGLLRRTLGEDIELVIKLSPDACPVEMDPSQFTQVLMNLVVNARDAMAAGGTLTLRVSYRRLDGEDLVSTALGPGDWSVLTVSDTGAGIEPSNMPRIFEPFFTTKRPGEGTGLGLSTAYGIVKQSGGEIVVSSDVGKGATFEVYLPSVEAGVETGGDSGAAPAQRPGPPKTSRMIGETILLVEDEAAVRKLAARLLQEQGYSVLAAGDGPQALRFARNRSLAIDLLLTDVVLPGAMQGDEVARSVLAERPRVKVLFMSGYPREARLRLGGPDEAVNYLEKPFTAEDLVAKVREVLASGV